MPALASSREGCVEGRRRLKETGERDRETERHRDPETERQRDRETERPRDTDRERQRKRETEEQRAKRERTPPPKIAALRLWTRNALQAIFRDEQRMRNVDPFDLERYSERYSERCTAILIVRYPPPPRFGRSE